MNVSTHKTSYKTSIAAGVVGLLGGLFSGSAAAGVSQVEVESGTAAFEAGTNMPGVEVRGKSSALSARLELSTEGNGLVLDQIEASVPIKSLTTGMKVRDEHMRKYIFTTSDGQEPDLHFSSSKANCPAKGSGHEFVCRLAGTLTVRGVPKPLAMNLNVKEQGGSGASYRAAGDAVVKLSDYGIEPPSQFGVKPLNEVKLHLELSGKSRPTAVAKVEGDR